MGRAKPGQGDKKQISMKLPAAFRSLVASEIERRKNEFGNEEVVKELLMVSGVVASICTDGRCLVGAKKVLDQYGGRRMRGRPKKSSWEPAEAPPGVAFALGEPGMNRDDVELMLAVFRGEVEGVPGLIQKLT